VRYFSSCRCIAALSGYNIQTLNIPTLEEYISRYTQLMSVPSVNHWNFYMAYVMFRGAAILQGVYKRFTLGLLCATYILIY